MFFPAKNQKYYKPNSMYKLLIENITYASPDLSLPVGPSSWTFWRSCLPTTCIRLPYTSACAGQNHSYPAKKRHCNTGRNYQQSWKTQFIRQHWNMFSCLTEGYNNNFTAKNISFIENVTVAKNSVSNSIKIGCYRWSNHT